MNTKLRDALNNSQKQDLEEVCLTFAKYSNSVAFKYLWNLTYNPENALDKMGLIDQEFLTYHKKVRNYIAEESGHLNFVSDAENYSKYLFKSLNQDRFATKIIGMAIENVIYSYPMSELERIDKLLSSMEENNQFGGLKSLKLTNNEANYFLKYIKPISEYFTIKLEEVKKNLAITNCNKKELISEDEKLEKPSLIDNVPETITEVMESEGIVNNTISMVEMLLKNKEAINKFLKVCYNSNACDSNSKKWNTVWLLESPETFKKVFQMLQIWEDLKSEIMDYNLIFKKTDEWEKNNMVMNHAKDLRDLGLNPEWIWKNRDMVANLFYGLNGAAL